MPDLALKRILIRNWMTCKEASLEFPSQGLIWVSGVVGSGKTALGEAICRTLIGTVGRFSRLGEYSTLEKGNLYVRLEGELKGKLLTVESGHKCAELSKTGEGLRFTYGGQRTERGHIEETRQELTQAIRISPKLARWAVFIDGDKLEFSALPEKEAVELLMESLAQPPWTQWHEQAKNTMASFAVNQAQVEAEHAAATRQRVEALAALERAKGDLERAQADHEAAIKKQAPELAKKRARHEELKASVTVIRQKIVDIKDSLCQVEEKQAVEYHAIEIERQSILDRLAKAKGPQKLAIDAHGQATAEARQLNRTLAEMLAVPANCPRCNRPWDQAHSEQEISAIRADLKAAELKLAEMASAKGDAERAVDSLNSMLEAVDLKSGGLRRKVRAQVDELSRSAERLEGQRDDAEADAVAIERAIAALEAGPSTAGIERAETVLSERAKAVEAIEKMVKMASTAIVEAKEAIKVVRYWVKAFSAVGIPNMVLKDSIGPMNDTSRRISATLTGGSLNVNYDTSQEMASGLERAKLIINVEHRHGVIHRTGSVKGSSKGQAGLANLIVAETLSTVGNVSSRVGFRWYDEVLNSQDPLVRRAALSYLKEMAHRLGILIFIVDHHPEPASYADRILLVELDANEATTLRWAT